MKTIIAGGRNITLDEYNEAISEFYIEQPWVVTEAVNGCAAGVDSYSDNYFISKVPIKRFPAKWKNIGVPGAVIRTNEYGMYNAKAGHDRNEEMAKYSDALILIWDGKSKGSKNMLETAKKYNLKIWEHIV